MIWPQPAVSSRQIESVRPGEEFYSRAISKISVVGSSRNPPAFESRVQKMEGRRSDDPCREVSSRPSRDSERGQTKVLSLFLSVLGVGWAIARHTPTCDYPRRRFGDDANRNSGTIHRDAEYGDRPLVASEGRRTLKPHQSGSTARRRKIPPEVGIWRSEADRPDYSGCAGRGRTRKELRCLRRAFSLHQGYDRARPLD